MDIHQCSVRFNDNNINQHKAWGISPTQRYEKISVLCSTYCESVVYFIEQDNTRTENKIIEQENKLIDKICKAVQKCIAYALSSEILKQVFNSDKNSEDNIESESNISDVDWDYLCGNDN